MANEPGHVFVARGDLRQLACEALLVPTDEAVRIGADWSDLVPHPPDLDASWPAQPQRVTSRATPGDATAPQVWLTATAMLAGGGGPPDEVEQALDVLLQRVEAFVAVAAEAARQGGHDRARPLLGLPVVGTGEGGLRARPGAVARALVTRLLELADEHAVDLVLVANTPQLEALCRHWRRRRWSDRAGGADAHRQLVLDRWVRGRVADRHVLTEGAGSHLAMLVERGLRGSLVPFFGSGVSRASGAPSWADLLDALSPPGVTELFDDLSGSDAQQMTDLFARAQVIANLGAGGTELRRRLAERLGLERLSLLHVLLANLDARDAVTTNYDVGYERACEAAGIDVAIVPRPGGSHRLVKLHGSLGADGGDPLITRDELLDFQADRGAIAGVLQMLLLTGHLLFVGYSMSDPSLHAAMHAVRRALEQDRQRRRPMATSLQVDPSPAMAALWDRTVEVVWPDADRYPTTADRVRQKEILLDLLADAASQASVPVLAMDDEAARLDLTEDEIELRDGLVRLQEVFERRADRGPLWGPVAALLERFTGGVDQDRGPGGA